MKITFSIHEIGDINAHCTGHSVPHLRISYLTVDQRGPCGGESVIDKLPTTVFFIAVSPDRIDPARFARSLPG